MGFGAMYGQILFQTFFVNLQTLKIFILWQILSFIFFNLIFFPSRYFSEIHFDKSHIPKRDESG